MSTTRVTGKAIDTWVNEARPGDNNLAAITLGMNAATNAQARAFVWLPIPIPKGAKVLTAILRLYSHSSWGNTTLTVRRVTERVPFGRVTWAEQPPVGNTTATLTKASSSRGTEWAIPVASLVQEVVSGAAWHGFRITTSASTLQRVFSYEGVDADWRPTLELVWTEAPKAPTDLAPSGGRSVSVSKPILTFTHNDRVAGDALEAVQVQIDPAGLWSDPLFDSGMVAQTVAQFDTAGFSAARSVNVTRTLNSATVTAPSGTFARADIGAGITSTGIPANTTITAVASSTSATISAAATSAGTAAATITRVYTGLGAGGATRWRVRTWNDSGPSPWSEEATFIRTGKPSASITNPAAPPNDYVTEPTPPIIWSMTGQTGWRVTVLDAAGEKLHTTGWQAGTANTWTVPPKVLTDLGATYMVVVDLRDGVQRESTPGDPGWVTVSRSFQLQTVGTVTAPAGVTVTQPDMLPRVRVTWTRGTAPDRWVVLRDDRLVSADLLPADTLISGTSHAWDDWEANPRVPHVYKVAAVVNGQQSVVAASQPYTLTFGGVWLVDPEDGLSVFVVGANPVSWGMGEVSSVLTPHGSRESVLVSESLRGWEGTVEGELRDLNGYTAGEWRDRFLRLRARRRSFVLSAADRAIRVRIYDSAVGNTSDTVGVKTVSFAFFQVDTPLAASL